MTPCINCGTAPVQSLLSVARLPVLCNELHSSPASARQAPVGRMDLTFCSCCGHYFNRSFRPELMYYSASYETSLYASGVFRRYADALVERLISTYHIRDKQILEIGCGRGEFLRHLCRAGGNRGVGFDTSTPLEGKDKQVDGVTYVRDYYSAAYPEVRADLIVCQQVLEHTENPGVFLRDLAATQAFQVGQPVVYFEVPNGLFTARELGIWDLIYEHISYFTPTSLRLLFESAGFDILDLGSTYGDQYLYVEARLRQCDRIASGGAQAQAAIATSDVELARSFADCFRTRLRFFQAWHKCVGSDIERTYVWGAGSKGITFCNLVDPAGRLAGLIDRNTAKQGKYIAGTGIRVFQLEEIAPSTIVNVVVMNPQYTAEVASDLAQQGIAANVLDVMEYGR